MEVLLAVIDDLFHFARTSLLEMLVQKDKLAITSSAGKTSVTPFSHALHSVLPSISFRPLLPEHALGSQYFIGEKETYMYIDPVISFDSATKKLQYGDFVQVLKLGGRWAYVRIREKDGWILKDALRDKAADVFPSFTLGAVYAHESPDTIKLRLCIQDQFQGSVSSSILSDAEYVTYKLSRKGKQILWGDARPRIAGTWQQRLKGQSGIHIGIKPKTESVMEYIADSIGHLAFVEAVFPDDTVEVSAIGLQNDGEFTKKAMSKEEWIELRPVFIQVL